MGTKRERSRSEDFSTTGLPGTYSADNALDAITPTKKRRIVFDGVEVPTLQSLLSLTKQEFGGKVEPLELKEEEIRERLNALKNHNIKQSNDAGFLLDTIHSRMRIIGYELYEITVPTHILDATFSREYIKDTYGGNTVWTFPPIAQKHIDRHGLRNFMHLNLDYNPYAPQIPGSPGLFFECELYTKDRGIQRVFTKHAAGKWQLQGLYELIPCLSLTKDEWRALKPSVRNTWCKNIHEQGYGRNVRVRIMLRQQLGREPKVVEVENKIKSDKKNKIKTISLDDVVRAYDRGDEAIAVWCMKCVGYDEAFQRTNIDGFAAWNLKKADEARGRVSNPVDGTKSKKRTDAVKKRSVDNITLDEDVKDYADVIPRGTRSRPMRGIRVAAQ